MHGSLSQHPLQWMVWGLGTGATLLSAFTLILPVYITNVNQHIHLHASRFCIVYCMTKENNYNSSVCPFPVILTMYWKLTWLWVMLFISEVVTLWYMTFLRQLVLIQLESTFPIFMEPFFINMFTKAYPDIVQSNHTKFLLRSSFTLSSHLCLDHPKWSPPFRFSNQTFICISHLSHAILHALPI